MVWPTILHWDPSWSDTNPNIKLFQALFTFKFNQNKCIQLAIIQFFRTTNQRLARQRICWYMAEPTILHWDPSWSGTNPNFKLFQVLVTSEYDQNKCIQLVAIKFFWTANQRSEAAHPLVYGGASYPTQRPLLKWH